MPVSARNAATSSQERLVFNRSVDNALAGLLLTLSLPLLAFYSILAQLDSVRPAFLRRFRVGRKFSRLELLKLQFAEEFGFERAIEAYEELIDFTVAGRQP
jgi:lipopolysaccharide/colanic/teichoic acid biosynthesis glycosyltransferase